MLYVLFLCITALKISLRREDLQHEFDAIRDVARSGGE